MTTELDTIKQRVLDRRQRRRALREMAAANAERTPLPSLPPRHVRQLGLNGYKVTPWGLVFTEALYWTRKED